MLIKEYCYYCDTETEYEIKEDFIKTNIKGVEFEYMANIAYCKECGEEIYISELDDENIKRANKKYREILGLIEISEIEEILRKYNIGKKPLSLLLSWGETTIIRYLNGLTPSKEYSEKLKEILINPYKMKEIFEENKKVLSPVALKKLETRINTIICQPPISSNCKESKLLNTAKFFLFKIDEEAGDVITPLKLQKLVYYAQAWFTAYFGKPLVTENCQAWIHGPVFPELYNYFKDKGYSPIPKVSNLDMSVFNDDEKYILETVWKVYGKYHAKYLEELTHMEYPWNIARNGFSHDERCNEVICIDSIKEYYTHVKNVNNIKTDKDLNKYVSNIDVPNF